MFIWFAAAAAAFFVKGLCGFANTLVFTAILSFGTANIAISPVELVLGYPSNAIMVWRERAHIKPKLCLPLAALVVLGSMPGIIFLKSSDTGVIKAVFGAVIILIGLEMLLRERLPRRAAPSKAALAAVGVLSGVLCGLYGVGALLGAYMSRVARDSDEFKANLCAVFLAENTLRIIFYAWYGIINAEALKRAALLLPFMLLGLFAGIRGAKALNEAAVKKLVIVLLIISGAVLLVSNL